MKNTFMAKIEKRSADMMTTTTSSLDSASYATGEPRISSRESSQIIYSTTFTTDAVFPNGSNRYSISNRDVFEACDGADEAVLQFDGDKLVSVEVDGYRVPVGGKKGLVYAVLAAGALATVIALGGLIGIVS